jgi:molybdopterin biosynthesis enzyme
VAPADLPRFGAVAVDGYAVASADLEAGCARLRIVDRAAAGDLVDFVPMPRR